MPKLEFGKSPIVFSKKLPKGKFFKTITKEIMNERKNNKITKLNNLELPATIKSK